MRALLTITWTVLVLWVTQTTSTSAVQRSCGPIAGWFGKYCYKCHCENNYCKEDGSCYNRAKCVKGWFGPSCQYADLTYTEKAEPTPTWLSDGNDTTCNPEPNTQPAQSVSVTLSRPFPFTWLRIRVKDSVKVGSWEDDSIRVQFKRTRHDSVYHSSYYQENQVVVNDNTIDIFSNLNVEVEEVILSGQGVGSLCSVYISGGRNVALKQNTNQSSTYHEGPRYAGLSLVAVDGDTNGDWNGSSCTHTNGSSDPNPSWTLTLDQPYVVNRYIVYNRIDGGHSYRLRGFNMKMFDENGYNYKDWYTDSTHTAAGVYNITKPKPSYAVSKVTIAAAPAPAPAPPPPNANIQSILTLCEVEMYGDCPSGKYGLTCKDCGGNCKSGKCSPTTGHCFGCEAGFHGDKCETPCVGNCKDKKCDQYSQKCTEGCEKGFTGVYCGQECRGHCHGNQCSQDDGRCFSCETGYYGTTCTTPCSTQCYYTDKRCERESGKCTDGCVAGYTGDLCNETCPIGQFGHKCAQTCSQGCNGSDGNHKYCNAETGSCLYGCKDGYNMGNENNCTDCEAGRYSSDCSGKCPNCKGGLCRRSDGYCKDGCNKGYYGPSCTEPCSTQCKDGICYQNDQYSYRGVQYKAGTCSEGCNNGYTGAMCNETCNDQCKDKTCEQHSGECSNGCTDGYKGRKCEDTCGNNCRGNTCQQYNGKCDKGCIDGFTGSACDKNCSANCKKITCNQDNGNCDHGCLDGYMRPTCDSKCHSGRYGPDCNSYCSVNCKYVGYRSKCHHEDGKCTDGCKDGYYGDKCESACPSGKYGDGCSKNCSTTCKTKECDKANGHCIGGCVTGYYGEWCEEGCGENCKNKTCEQKSGKCTEGCEDGFTGDNCSKICSTTCKDNVCSQSDGDCLRGCKDGFTGFRCEDNCPDGSYGHNCSLNCSSTCITNVTHGISCHHIHGSCLLGCVTGYKGDQCEIAQTSGGSLGVAIAVICLIVVLIVTVTLLIIYIHQKRKGTKKETGNAARNNNNANNARSAANDNVVVEAEVPAQNEPRSPSQAASSAAKPAASGGDGLEMVNMAAAGPSTSANKPDVRPKVLPLSKTKDVLAKLKGKGLKVKGKGKGKGKRSAEGGSKPSSETAIAVHDLDLFIMSKTKEFFQQQFSEIPSNQKATTKAAESDQNKSKNRYKNIFPYDHSRVHLEINEAKQQGDYINASHIEGYKGEEKFIACQGPTPAVIADFIRMLWEQKVEKVVMLTNLVEDGKTKCERYWPEQEDKMEFGDITITPLTTQVFADHTIRRLQLVKEGAAPQIVVHYHYTTWPDKDVPTTPWGLVDFEQRVAAQATDKLIVVHCSAGVGRTGTFIALRNVMRQAEDTGYVDCFTTVKKLRHDRVLMVQTASQYEFLHKAANIALLCMGTTVKAGKIQERIKHLEKNSEPGETLMEKEFKALCKASDEGDETADENENTGEGGDVYQNSRSLINKVKNRVRNILPKEYFRVELEHLESDMDDYINAVSVPSFRKQDQQILTQLPLKVTVNDFWRMVTQHDVALIVAFDLDYKDSDTTIGDYLPTAEDKPLELPVCTVAVTSTTKKQTSEEQKMTVTPTGKWKEKLGSIEVAQGERSVTHLKCKLTKLDPPSLLTLLIQIRSLSPGGDKKTVYMCRNGADYSGLVCVLSLLLDRLDSDQYLTVPLVVGAIKAIRPQVIPSLEQYKLLYQVLERYNDTTNEYSNM